jgi:alcohol dehydrogenase (cytochrome c)
MVKMRSPRSLIVCCSLLILTLFICAVGQSGGQTANVGVQSAQLLSHTINENWPSYNGDYTGRRFSSLTQITPGNVGQLRAEWVFHSKNSSKLEVTPVVVDGVMYITASNDVFALNSTNGRTLWHYSRPVSQGLIDDAAGHINRGVALLGTRLYAETDNAHLVCLDARSGHLLWDVAYADWNKNYGATSAPLVIKDKVLVGTSGGDSGVRGFLAAYDAMTGKLVWRLWTIPGPGEFGSSSWPGDSYLHGGGTTWMPGTYDPELNTVYWGTGNAGPDYDGDVRPGDDLYTACLLAIDPDNGKLKWYFQFTPHDLYDYDGVETPVLIDRVYQGKPRKLLVEANRNGFLYVLDRIDGKFLSATQFAARLNWATGIDANGRPIVSGLQPTDKGTFICPGDVGATNWFSPSYSEFTHQFYLSAFNICSTYFKKPAMFAEGSNYYSTGTTHDSKDRGKKELLAFDLDKNSFAWRYPQDGDSHSWGGVMTTASGLVFFADDAESFEAVDAKTGKSLWHFNTGQTFHASPMSYSVGGKQYVAIASGDDLFSFALP